MSDLSPQGMDDGWSEYRLLIIKELERNESNIKRILDVTEEMNRKLIEVDGAVKGIQSDVHHNKISEEELSNRIVKIEKDLVSLKTKVVLVGAAISAIASGILTLAFKAIS